MTASFDIKTILLSHTLFDEDDPLSSTDMHTDICSNASTKVLSGSRVASYSLTTEKDEEEIHTTRRRGFRESVRLGLPTFFNSRDRTRSRGVRNFDTNTRITRRWRFNKIKTELYCDSPVDDKDDYYCSYQFTDKLGSSKIPTTFPTRTHRVRFWLNDENHASSLIDDTASIQSSTSTKVDTTIIFQRSPKHRFRFWLNEKQNTDGYAGSIIEVRESKLTARISAARNMARSVASEAAQIGEFRRKARAARFAGAAAAAAFARVKAAINDSDASHGSIANAAMYAFKAVAASSVVPREYNHDYKRLQELFYDHFRYRGRGYFRSIRPLNIKDLDKTSTIYKMHHKMKAVPNPPLNCDILRFYMDRFNAMELKYADSNSIATAGPQPKAEALVTI